MRLVSNGWVTAVLKISHLLSPALMMLAIEASETSAKIENKPQPNSLKKVFNKKKNSDSGYERLRQFTKKNVFKSHLIYLNMISHIV